MVSRAVVALMAGAGVVEITPPDGTPGAGYAVRSETMEGVRDPLLASAVVFVGEESLALVGVDHMGFDSGMVREIQRRVETLDGLEGCRVIVGSSHTHAGGGGTMPIPAIEAVTGHYDKGLREGYIACTVEAIRLAGRALRPAAVAVGVGEAAGLSQYRGSYPVGLETNDRVTVIRVDALDGEPIALVFHYACHPTILGPDNRRFSADFVGEARKAISHGVPIYFNGAQGEVIPASGLSVEEMGQRLAKQVTAISEMLEPQERATIRARKSPYTFNTELVGPYESELNLVQIGDQRFLTIPGELSLAYEARLPDDLTILGLTNGAHGYIILPEAHARGTKESRLSFGGAEYGERVYELAMDLYSGQHG